MELELARDPGKESLQAQIEIMQEREVLLNDLLNQHLCEGAGYRRTPSGVEVI